MQREKPASLFLSTVTNHRIPTIDVYSSPVTGATRLGYSDRSLFALRLGGPFGAVISGRTFTNRLLSKW